MNIKNGLTFVLIVAILALCVPNVVVAPTSKQTLNVRSSYAMDASVKGNPKLVFLPSRNITAVNAPVDFYGALATDSKALYTTSEAQS